MTKTLSVIAVLVLLGLATSGRWFGLGREADAGAPPSTRATVQRGDLAITIEENGYLTAKNNVNVKPKFKGQGTITWLVEEGKSVEPGELLVEFDKTQLEASVSELENSLVQFEIELETARANQEIQERDNQAAIEKAELGLEMARLTKERYTEGEAPNEERKLKLAAEKSSSELERARERFQQVPELVAQGFLTRINEEEERIKVREAEINQENAERDLELYEAYTKRMELKKKETEVKDAERELENSRKKADINLKERQAMVAQRERQVQSTKTRLEQQRTELGHYTIKAERPGIVHYGDPSEPWEREQIKVGNTVYQGWVVVTIPDLSEMQVLIQVHEADITQVKEGLPVLITVETQKGASFTAKITEIASVASSASWTDESNKSFRVVVTLDETDVQLRAGVTAKAEVQVETLADVLYVPIHAVVPEGKQHLCFLWKDGQPAERVVEIGKNNAHYVQILAGLEEGEEVLLFDPRNQGLGSGSRRREGGAPEEAAPSAESALPGAPVAEE